jgi:hypothetical protein
MCIFGELPAAAKASNLTRLPWRVATQTPSSDVWTHTLPKGEKKLEAAQTLGMSASDGVKTWGQPSKQS